VIEVENMEGHNFPETSLPTVTPLPNIGLLVELGRQRGKEIRQLKEGDGPLTWQIEAAVTSWRKELGINADAEVVPVVLLYRELEKDYVVIAPAADMAR
jgi:hypothetical protein